MSCSSERQKSIRKMPGKRKRVSNFCSTPIGENARRLSSISISAVDTNSSSSTKSKILKVDLERKRIKKKQSQRNNLKQKEGKQRGTTSKAMGEGKRKKKKFIEQKKSDDDWETYDESLRQSTEFESNVLFQDIRSPEYIRDAPPPFIHDRLDSPILKLRGSKVHSPEEITFKENEARLLVKDFPISHIRFDDDDDEEDMLSFRKEITVKAYPGLKNKELQRNNARIEKCKPWLVNVPGPITSSDVLWEKFVRNNYDKVAEYLVPLGNNRQRYQHRTGKNIGIDEYESFEEEDNYDEQPSKWKCKIPLVVPNNMEVAYGYCDKSSRKWVRVHHVYSFPQNEDVELKKNGGSIAHITLNQFLQKNKLVRKNRTELGLTSSRVIYSPNVRKNCDEEKCKKKRFFQHSKSEIQKFDALKMQRISKVCKFASQLNATKKTMCSNGTSSVPTLKDTKPNSVLKRVNGANAYKKEDDTKRISLIAMKNKPKVMSMESLTTVRFKKDKQNWCIVKNLV